MKAKPLAQQLPNPHDLMETMEDTRAEKMHQFQDALGQVWAQTLTLPPEQAQTVQQSIQQMWDGLQDNNSLVDRLGGLLKQQDAVMTGLMATTREAVRQRDAIADAFHEHLTAVKHGDEPTVKRMVNAAYEEGFEAARLNKSRLADLAEKLKWPTSEAG